MFTSDKSSSKGTSNVIPQNQSLASLIFADRPLSGVSYVKHKLQKFNLVPTAQAATPGFGFTTALDPIQPMWKAVRDIAFGMFVIVAIVFSFMIMFRVKISPQVVISVQSAIPKIITALILTTFSYAIAGFMIDLMYVVIGLVSVIMAPLVSNTSSVTPAQIFNFLTLGNMGGVGSFTWNSGVFGLLIIYMVLLILFALIFLIMNMGLLVTGAAAAVGVATLSTGIPILIALLIVVIAVIIVMWISVKTWWALIKAFASVLLLTIFAPLQITLGTLIPNFGFGAWFKSFAAALSTFVVTGVLMLLAFVFLVQGVTIGLKNYAPTVGAAVVRFISTVPVVASSQSQS